jgi:rhodanese-related sulfurtransferase
MSLLHPDSLEVAPPTVAQLIADPEAIRLIDCREEDEWTFNHLPQAEWMPLSRFGELSHLRFQDPAERMIIYCHHGMRSQNAAHFLRTKGFPNVWSMTGGIEAWALEIDPTMPRY